MKPTACRRNDIGGVPARWAWVPLEHREAVLIMHEITVCVVEGAMSRWFRLPKTYHRYDDRHGLREWSSTSTGRTTDGGLDPCKGGLKGGMLSHLGGTDMGVREEAEMNSVYLPRKS